MEYIKVSFVGDIMCEKAFLKAARTNANQYDFEQAFSGLRGLFQKSDYVIGNLETVCAGEGKKYTHELYSFNTPDSFACAIKKCGIGFVSTANNHCLDRGVEGLKRTLDVLDSYGIRHTGTYRNDQESVQPCVVDIDGFKLGLIAYTYGTNPNMNGVLLSEDESFCVDLLQPQEYHRDTSISSRIKGLLSVEVKTKIKKFLGMPYKNVSIDNMPKCIDEGYLKRLSESIARIKGCADYTICLLHCGGQFNREPGVYSQYMMDYLREQGVDSIIGNHPHNVQKSQCIPNGIITYCLGNVSISPSSIYVPMENHPDYSIVVHLYFDKKSKKLEKTTVSVLKIQEDQRNYLRVAPVWDLYQNVAGDKRDELYEATREVLQVFLNKELIDFRMQEEWDVTL